MRHELLSSGPEEGPRVVLAHGAGAPMDSPFMETMAQGLASSGLRVIRFEFPYMARRRTTGKKAGPNTARVLMETWREVIDDLGDPGSLVIGGKSMGGRVASMVAAESDVAGVVCLGYPFHPPGKPERTRTEHLRELRVPSLIIQGERDPFGRPEEVGGYDLSDNVAVTWLPDGDHGFKPRKRSGITWDENLSSAIEQVVSFVRDREAARISST